MKRFESKEWRDSMRLRVDYSNMMRDFAGEHGIAPEALDSHREAYESAAIRVEEKRGEMKWRELPFNQTQVIPAILETAAWVRANCDAFVVLGIGGSALQLVFAVLIIMLLVRPAGLLGKYVPEKV